MKLSFSPRNLPPAWGAGLTYFFSSAAIMAMQLVAGRIVAQYLGQSVYTWTSIIGVTLAGIALGNYLGGRLADRSARAGILAGLFLLAAFAEVSVLMLNHLVGHFTLLTPLPWPARIFLHVFFVFLAPFTCLGTIGPVLTRRALGLGGAAGRTMGMLYALSLAGSLLGTFATGYLLLAWLGNTAIVYCSGMGLATLGALYAWAGWREPKALPQAVLSPAAAALRVPRTGIALMVTAGMAVMMIEIIAGRFLAQQFGNSLYTWTTIIGVILAAMSLGGLTGGRLADRYPGKTLLAGLFLLAAAAGLLGPFVNAQLRYSSLLWGFPWPVQIALHCIAVFFPSTFLLGAIPPAVVRLAIAEVAVEQHGKTIGTLYASHAAGSIAGTFLAGYVAITALGSAPSWCAVSGALMLVAFLLARENLFVWTCASVCALLLACVFAPVTGLNKLAASLALRPKYDVEVKYAGESQYGYIAVQTPDLERPNERILILDKLVHNRTDLDHPEDLKYQYEWFYQNVLETLRPAPAPLRALAIGGGGYTFSHCLEITRPGSHIEVAEIDPAVTEAAHAAFGLPRDTTIQIHHLDGRNYVEKLAASLSDNDPASRFDCILGDSVNDYSVPFHLTTLEYTRLLGKLLTDDGVYLLNMIDMYDSGRFLGAMIDTCLEVFPEVQVFCSTGTLDRRETFVLACSRKPLALDGIVETINKTHRNTGTRLTEEQIASLRERSQGMLLTDDFAPVENLLAPVVRQTEDNSLTRYLQRADLYISRGKYDWAIHDALWVARQENPPVEAFELLSAALRHEGRLAEAVEAGRQAVTRAPNGVEAQRCLARALYESGDFATSLTHWQRALELQPDDSGLRASLGGVLLRLNRLDDAIANLRRALQDSPKLEAARINLAGALFLKGDTAGAVENLRAALEVNPGDVAARAQLAAAYWKLKQYDDAWNEVKRCAELGGTLDPGFVEALKRDSGRSGL